jgi:hypothetical protein
VSESISAVLTYAVGVGLSPIPIVAVIVVLFSARATVNGPLFLAGWMAGLATMVTAVQLVAGRLGAGTSGTVDDGISWFRVLLGAVLLVAAIRKWRHRPGPGEEPSLPGWMARVEGFAPAQALGLGLLLGFNPKNIALAFGAGMSLAQIDAPIGHTATAIAVFVLVGSAGVMSAVAHALIGGATARQRLDDTRAWLVLHNGALMAAVFLVFAALLISEGLGLRR